MGCHPYRDRYPFYIKKPGDDPFRMAYNLSTMAIDFYPLGDLHSTCQRLY